MFARRPASAALLFACLIAPAAPIALKVAVAHVELPSLDPETGALVLDRNGALLRPFAISDGRWRLPATLAEVDPLFIKTLIAYEDRRFREHRGVDVQALFRAACQLVAPRPPRLRRLHASPCRWRGFCSDESTRIARRQTPPDADRRWRSSERLDKDEILDLYLTLAPYGGNIEGVRAASLAYLGKEPRRLTPAEAALLVALPQAPEARRPDRHPQAARSARATACSRAPREAGVFTAEDVAASRRRRRCPTRRYAFPDARAARRRARSSPRRRTSRSHRLTIDATLPGAAGIARIASARRRSPIPSRSRSSSPTTRPARSSPRSAPPTSSTSAATASST